MPERDPRALADALARLLDDQALGAGLALQGRAAVEQSYDSRRQARALGELLSGRPAPAGMAVA